MKKVHFEDPQKQGRTLCGQRAKSSNIADTRLSCTCENCWRVFERRAAIGTDDNDECP